MIRGVRVDPPSHDRGGDTQGPGPSRGLDSLEVDRPPGDLAEKAADVVYYRLREVRREPPFSAATALGAAEWESAGNSSRVSQIWTLVSISSSTTF